MLLALVRAGPSGLRVGEIQQRTAVAGSTLTHHLRCLADAGLIEQSKQGREIINHANFQRIEALAQYLLRECCSEA